MLQHIVYDQNQQMRGSEESETCRLFSTIYLPQVATAGQQHSGTLIHTGKHGYRKRFNGHARVKCKLMQCLIFLEAPR
jgi:hypothetical protein